MALRPLLRMERAASGLAATVPPGISIVVYEPATHHSIIPGMYAAAFGRPPWPNDWDEFGEFDPAGVFVAEPAEGDRFAGFLISFCRGDFGYISVVAVVPGYQRRGIASSLVARAVERSESLGMTKVRVDAWEDSPAAVLTYRQLGFEVYERKMEEDD
jgi:ribosomal protein S18 acetylase RimI-like enzyme